MEIHYQMSRNNICIHAYNFVYRIICIHKYTSSKHIIYIYTSHLYKYALAILREILCSYLAYIPILYKYHIQGCPEKNVWSEIIKNIKNY